MPTPQELAEYEQYLRETGQIPNPQPTPRPDNGNWGKLSQLGGMLSPGSEWSMPEEETLADPTVQEALKNSARQNLAVAGGGAAGEIAALGGAGATGLMAGSKRALTGGTINAAAAPDGERLKAFLLGTGIQGGAEVLGAAAGKVGDYAMQIAANRKKYTPGVGTTLANEGLWGTEDMLRKQVQAREADAFEDMLKAAQGAKPIDSRRIGKEIAQEASAKYNTDAMGRPMQARQRDVPTLNAINEFAEDISGMGQESAVQALGRRRAAGQAGYSQKSGNALQSKPAELSKMEQQKYSEALKKSDSTGQLAQADTRYAALKRAERGLSEEAALPKSVMGVASYGANKLPGGSIAASTVGQLGVKGGKLADFLAPLGRHAAIGGIRDPGPSAQELAEYEQYLRETGQK